MSCPLCFKNLYSGAISMSCHANLKLEDKMISRFGHWWLSHALNSEHAQFSSN